MARAEDLESAALPGAGMLGVLGGMGPRATAAFLHHLVDVTSASCDQEHIPVLLYGDCRIPDRTCGAVGAGPSPVPALRRGLRFLDAAGVEAICIPCNSAHAWFREITEGITTPVLNIVEACLDALQASAAPVKTVGILSTLGTHHARLYAPPLEALGYSVASPSATEHRELVSPAIAHVKAGRIAAAQPLLREAVIRLQERDADAIILGCTEVPLGLDVGSLDSPPVLIDSNWALALAAVRTMGRR